MLRGGLVKQACGKKVDGPGREHCEKNGRAIKERVVVADMHTRNN
jgi:hypothetical protein